eukprot:IDg8149t1
MRALHLKESEAGAWEQPVFWLGSPSPFTLDETSVTANSLLYKSGTRLQRLHAVSDARVRNADITPDESRKTNALCSNLFYSAIAERQSLFDLVNNLHEVKDIVIQMMGCEFGFEKCILPSTKQVRHLVIISNRIESIRMDVLFRYVLLKRNWAKRRACLGLIHALLKNGKYPALCVKRNMQTAVESISILKIVYQHILRFTSSRSVKTILKYTNKKIYVVTSDICSSYAEVMTSLKELQVLLEAQLSAAENIANSSISSSLLRSVIQFLRTETSFDDLKAHGLPSEKPNISSDDKGSVEDA